MEGVILFADDEVNTPGSPENSLFLKLAAEYPVLPISNLDLADQSLKAIGTFSAIILDWDFAIKDESGKTIRIVHPDIILDAEFYSLIYIFSRNALPPNKQTELKSKYGDRIQFHEKRIGNIEADFAKIKTDIAKWKTDNQNLAVPIQWSHSINQVVQNIFSELAKADINWILNLHETANSDGVNPEIEVIYLLQNLLAEKIITDVNLSDRIKELVENSKKTTPILADGASIAKLFQRIYYTDLTPFSLAQIPIMTGDIFLLNNETKTYGVVVSPECDMQDIGSSAHLYFELLTFKESDFSLKNFTELFGFKSAKLSVKNQLIIDAINNVVVDNFKKLNAGAMPPPLFKKEKIKNSAEEMARTGEKHKIEYNPVEEDVLVKLVISQFQILLNKYISHVVRVKFNEQIREEGENVLYDLLLQSYNQTEKRIHLIPSFKFDHSDPNKTAVIDFREGKVFKKGAELSVTGVKRVCKLNNPFIQELRQRYLAYYGRIGVPKIPTVLRKFNINSLYPVT